MRGFDLVVAGLDCVLGWRGEVVAVGINGGLGSEEASWIGTGLRSGSDEEDIDTESVPSRFRPGCRHPSGLWWASTGRGRDPGSITRTGLWAETTPTLHANAGFN
jgi:hypothetical protein